MENGLNAFLNRSPAAEKVRVPGRIVVRRTELSPGELLNLRLKKTSLEVRERDMICELEIGGQVIAKGTVVRKNDAHYFKVSEIAGKGGAS